MSSLDPPVDPLPSIDGTEMVRARVGNRWRWIATALLKGLRGDKGDPGAKGDLGAPGIPKRVETYTSAKSSAAGLAKVTFSPAFASPPTVLPGIAWVGTQIIHAVPSNVTTTGCDVTLVRSKGALALSAGPFEIAANATGTVAVIGN